MAELTLRPKTIDDLPDEMLTAIFDYLKFYGKLRRASLVCKRWLNVLNNNIKFMRTVKFEISQENLLDLYKANSIAFTRDYRIVYFEEYAKFYELIDTIISLLKKAQYIKFNECEFQDLLEFKKVVDCCPNANEFELTYTKFVDARDIRKDEMQAEEHNRTSVRPVKCIMNRTSLSALQCIKGIFKLEVHALNELTDKKIIVENYASLLSHIEISNFAADEIIIVADKSRLKTIKLNDCGNVEILQHLFTKQQTYITSCTLTKLRRQDVLDVICGQLHNLETFECNMKSHEKSPIYFNNLKKLQKLRFLSLNSNYCDTICALNIDELKLVKFKIIATHELSEKIYKQYLQLQPVMASKYKKYTFHDIDLPQYVLRSAQRFDAEFKIFSCFCFEI